MAEKKESSRKTFAPFRWLKRGFFGGSKELSPENERYDSPGKLACKRFFRRPSACVATVVLICLFLFVFIGPIFDPFDPSYSETMMKNVAPGYDMMSVPSELASSLKEISSGGKFSVGLSNEGKVYLWGYTGFLSGEQSLEIPEEVANDRIAHIAAGTDHIVAISESGKVYAWGDKRNAQYDGIGSLTESLVQPEPEELLTDGVDASQVKQLVCGNQMTAIVMEDGSFYIWGNKASGASNLDTLMRPGNGKVEKLVFTSSKVLGLTQKGELMLLNAGNFRSYESKDGIVDTMEYIGERKVLDIAAISSSVAVLLEDGEILMLGGNADRNVPQIPEGDRAVALSGGAKHFGLLTEQGRVYVWGGGTLGQLDAPESVTEPGAADRLFSVGFQNYTVKDGKLVEKWGHGGYLMGTDELGRSIFNRVLNGGRMTMTIGAVAVIVSSIIGIIIGCISGYFGGKVDMVLMRVTEIFGSIPFLPFAIILSSIFQGGQVEIFGMTLVVTENRRIFIIMIILGLLSWTGLARLVRGQVLAEREKEFITAAKAMGIRERRIAFKHILPNVISVILVSMTLDFASCMLTESSLSYLGFGVRLPRPTWGNMLNGCNDAIVIQSYWWRWVFPALFLSVAVICINVIGDTLRDVLDPKSEVDR